MALIACPECGRKVSDLAAACPKCARPLGRSRPQVVEQTGKGWKAVQLVGALPAIGGVVAMLVGMDGGASQSGLTAFGLLAALVGPLVFAFGRAGAWWFHG